MAKDFFVVSLTRYMMDVFQISMDSSYEKLLETELYLLLIDSDIRFYLVINGYLCEACDVEQNQCQDTPMIK